MKWNSERVGSKPTHFRISTDTNFRLALKEYKRQGIQNLLIQKKIYPGLADPLTCMICRLHAIDYPDSPLVQHLPIFDQPAWQPIPIPAYCLLKSQMTIHDIVLFLFHTLFKSIHTLVHDHNKQ